MKVKIYNVFKATGKCRIFIAKGQFYPNRLALGTTKSEPVARLLSDEYAKFLSVPITKNKNQPKCIFLLGFYCYISLA